jgi:hypothetical protein
MKKIVLMASYCIYIIVLAYAEGIRRSTIAGNRDLVFLPLLPANTIHHCTAAKLLYNSKHAYTYKSHM